MKTAIILLLALAPFVVRGQADTDTKVGAYTNVNGIVLGLVFDQTTFDAINYVNAVMVVSNARPNEVPMRARGHYGWEALDTGIGDYIVTDANGKVLPKVVWALSNWQHGMQMPARGSIRGVGFRPGQSLEYPGDIMRRYSLTNPGVYQVKARAYVPNGVDYQDLVVETPPITITVTPTLRPPENRDLYTPEEVKMIPELTAYVASLPPLKLTHAPAQASAPKVEPPAPKVETPKEVVPVEAATNVDPVSAVALTPEPQPKRMLYYGVPMFVGGLGLFIIGVILWRSRRRQA